MDENSNTAPTGDATPETGFNSFTTSLNELNARIDNLIKEIDELKTLVLR